MKIAEINGCQIHMLPQDHTMVIIEKDAIFFRCTLCGEIKSVHMMVGSTEKDIPWLRLCFCNVSNAPHAGGDTQPLAEESEPAQAQEEVQPISPFVTGPIVVPPHFPIPLAFPARSIEREQ